MNPELLRSVSAPSSKSPSLLNAPPQMAQRHTTAGSQDSHLTDVVVNGVSVSLAHRVAHRLEHAVFVRVDLRHRHVNAVGVVGSVWSLRAVRWDALQKDT